MHGHVEEPDQQADAVARVGHCRVAEGLRHGGRLHALKTAGRRAPARYRSHCGGKFLGVGGVASATYVRSPSAGPPFSGGVDDPQPSSAASSRKRRFSSGVKGVVRSMNVVRRARRREWPSARRRRSDRRRSIHPIGGCARQRQDATPSCVHRDIARTPPGFEMLRVLDEGFHRVEVVLGEGKRAGGGRRPRVDERCLDDVVLFAVADEFRPSSTEPARRAALQPSRSAAKPAAHHVVDDDRVDLDADDAAGAEDERGPDVAAAARADDQRLAVRRHDRYGNAVTS